MNSVDSAAKRNPRKAADPHRILSSSFVSETHSSSSANSSSSSLFDQALIMSSSHHPSSNPALAGGDGAAATLAQIQAMFAANGAGGTIGGSAPALSAATPDPAVIFNLATAIAMNSLMAMNQQQPQSLAANPLIANAAKMMFGMNMLNQADLLGLSSSTSSAQPTTAQQEVPVTSSTSLHTAMLQQYAALTRQQSSVPVPTQPPPQFNPTALHMSLKRNMETSNDRKRSLPATVTHSGEDVKKRAARSLQDRQDSATARVPVSKDDIENCLDRILKEEIYNLYDEEPPKEVIKEVLNDSSPYLSSLTTTSDEDSKDSSTGGHSTSLVASACKEFSLLEIIDIVSGEPSELISSVGSAFRKVSARGDSATAGSPLSDSSPSWGVAISPPGSSPRSEPDISPPSPELLALVTEVARSLREADEEYTAANSIASGVQLETNPVVWRGQLQMKQNEAQVQLHLINGNRDFIFNTLGPLMEMGGSDLKIHINQRMRTDLPSMRNVMNRLARCGTACICVPIGLTKDECNSNNLSLRTHFLEYFANKAAAGIAMLPATNTAPASLVYVFPPNETTEKYMLESCRPMYTRVKSNNSLGYLFVVVLPQEDPPAPTAAAPTPVVAAT